MSNEQEEQKEQSDLNKPAAVDTMHTDYDIDEEEWVDDSPTDHQLPFDEVVKLAEIWLLTLINRMAFCDVICLKHTNPEENSIHFNLVAPDSSNSILSTLPAGKDCCSFIESIEALLRCVVDNLSNRSIRIHLDIENHIEVKTHSASQLATKLSETSKKIRKSLTIAGLTNFDRRIVHHSLANERHIQTSSIGEGPFRKLTLKSR